MTVIETRDLSRFFKARVRPRGFAASLRGMVKPEYRQVEAVRGVNLEVQAGEVVAFLGPNGAGKSTTIKMLTGILHPSGGTARVLGQDPVRERLALASGIGAVFGQKSQLWYHLPASDSFRLLGAVYEIGRAELKRRTAALVERFAIGPYLDTPVRKLSLGERVRCEIAASLLHKPKVLFLDEPTIGLDVVAKREVRALLDELRREDGVTIFLTSHDVGDIEKICKRAIIIHHGTVVVDESMKSLKHRALRKKRVGVKWAGPANAILPGLEPIKHTEDAAKYDVDTERHRLEDVIKALAERGEIVDLTVEDEPLEDIIAAIFASRSEEEAHVAAGARP